MSEFSGHPYILVPEFALLSSLPAHQVKRFETALALMHSESGQQLCWEQIAEQSAISPYHFHRQFTQVFHETPGQYLSRVRLQRAVSLLLSSPGQKITEVAFATGYSSSQALAKVIKRELGLTARAVRQLAKTGTPDETAALLSRLSHPAGSDSSEYQMAYDLPCERIWYPARHIRKQHRPDFDWDEIIQNWQPSCRKLCCVTPIADLERPWQEMRYTAGVIQESGISSDITLPEGDYFCALVCLTSDVAYIAAIESLFEQAASYGYKIDEGGCLIEQVIEVEPGELGRVTFMFQCLLK
ncbi:HTH-type transcriptional activator RhaS [Vibrio aerogenes CECT 7868]|uniref:HTH-type transcriptional activator RhaS n=1 Tax=Vibrio aerogenes CECT 7868 TaxID=1216006 RepID=A0A1M5Y9G3_9VIBR|nr:helix-turn-helix transcriptional regulator [Vibrio aerogenes]SHI08586.1 HTH-type transcriptional activator RhaS [Vibrio aerogenes CECT 7868]